MDKLVSKLRIGEKIGSGFGLVGMLFLGVIWQYNGTLQQSLADYQHLQDVFGAKKSHALAIESSMLGAQRSGMDFLIHRDELFAQDVNRHVEQVLQATSKLGAIDAAAEQTADQISKHMNAYHQRFQMMVEAWRKKGLDHNSGLQGAFRDTVHELEAMASRLKVGRLYLQLLQIRRGEKDLGLRREEQYRTNVLRLVEDFKKITADSELTDEVKTQLLQEIETYRETFEVYAGSVLKDEEIHGGKGPFRQAAHRLESLLNIHYVPNLETNILQLRRREKDYLLRDDKKYVEMTLQELKRIHAQVDASSISMVDKTHFMELIENYRRDFLALVEQNDHISRLNGEMRQAVSEVALLIEVNAAHADRMMNQIAKDISVSSSANARLMLWIVAVTTLLGIILAVSITLQITRPLRNMAGLLDRLAYEEPTERMSFVPGGRDEVNAMAESVNTMADHRKSFIAWWKASMQETDICRDLEKTLAEATGKEGEYSAELKDILEELLRAFVVKHEVRSEQYQEISRLNDLIVERTEHLLEERPLGAAETEIETIRHSAMSIRNIIVMFTFPNKSKKTVV